MSESSRPERPTNHDATEERDPPSVNTLDPVGEIKSDPLAKGLLDDHVGGVVPIAEPADPTDDDATVAALRHHGVRLTKGGGIAPRVFYPGAAIVLAVVLAGIIFPGPTGDALEGIQGWIVSNLGWYYTLAVSAFVVVALVIGMSRWGKIVIGRPGDEPEFGLLAWFAMLFAAGMGIGMVFYGVAEPLGFATDNIKPSAQDLEQNELIHQAMAQTFLHWGLHPWAIYVVIGLALAMAIHRRGRPVSIRWILEPVLGARVKGWMGDVVDVLAIVGTLFGVATSLGLGVGQISAGLVHLGLVDEATNPLMIGLIVVITIFATASVVSGVGKGIKWLSNINIGLAGLFVIAVLLAGPTLFIVRIMVEALGAYLGGLPSMSFDVSALTGEDGQTWQAGATIFYWGWWISWAPFVGVFIARISRGRTVREFVLGALIVPTLVAVVWFSVLGGAGLYRQFFTDNPMVPEGGELDANIALFDLVGAFAGPLAAVLSVCILIMVTLFFVTSSDSGSLVVDMLSSGGHPNPPIWSRVMWSVLEGGVAIALLLAGGLGALQAGAIATALPFSIVLLLGCVGLIKSMRETYSIVDAQEQLQRRHDFAAGLVQTVEEQFPERYGPLVDERIDYRLSRSYERRSDKGKDKGTPGQQS